MLSTQDQTLHRILQWHSADPHHTPYYAAMEKALEQNAAQILKKKKHFEQLKWAHLSLIKVPQAQDYNLEPYQTPPSPPLPNFSTISMTHWNPIIVDGNSYQNSFLDPHHTTRTTPTMKLDSPLGCSATNPIIID